MIKDILEQLAPLDAQIAALKGSGSDMEAITAHASELAELAVEEDEILRSCGPLTAEDRVFLARHPERPHIDETISALFTDFFEQRGDRQCKEDAAILGGVARFHGMPVTVIGHRKGNTLEHIREEWTSGTLLGLRSRFLIVEDGENASCFKCRTIR